MVDRYLKLQDIVLLGRTFDEYCRMFRLDDALLAHERIVDVASGVSSFCAEACERGYDVTASDRIYDFSPDEIERKCQRDLELVMSQLPAIADRYIWDFFPDVPALTRQREKAYRRFIPDYRQYGQQRYVPTKYPTAHFADSQFTVALSSHFLFSLLKKELQKDRLLSSSH